MASPPPRPLAWADRPLASAGASRARRQGRSPPLAPHLTSARRRKHFAFDQGADDVADDDMPLLHLWRLARRHAQAMIAERRHLATAQAGQANSHQPFRAALFERGKDVGRAAGGRESDEDVAVPGERFELAREDSGETII